MGLKKIVKKSKNQDSTVIEDVSRIGPRRKSVTKPTSRNIADIDVEKGR